MNVAAIAMSANLFKDQPMAPPPKSNRKHTPKIHSDDLEDSLLPPPFMMTSTVDDVSNEEEDALEDFDEDWREEGDDDSPKVNGTGLILYATPTATKAPYWKRRLGWKPNMARVQRHKFKNLFRSPMRRKATVGLSNAQEGDALLLVTKKPNQLHSTTSAIDGEAVQLEQPSPPLEHRQWEPEKEYVVDHDDQVKDKGWNAFHAVKHELAIV